MGQYTSTIIPIIIGYEIGRRVGLIDEIISEFSEDKRFIKYQYLMRPMIPQQLKTKIDTSIILIFFMVLILSFKDQPLILTMVLTSSLHSFGYDLCRRIKNSSLCGRATNILYNNGTLIWSLVSGR